MSIIKKFEKRNESLITGRQFAVRIGLFILLALAIEFTTVLFGSLGFHYIEGLGWLNSMLNATMVITGNGPVFEAQNNASKIFQIFFSIFGVIIFVLVISAILVPVLHRILHIFNMDTKDKN